MPGHRTGASAGREMMNAKPRPLTVNNVGNTLVCCSFVVFFSLSATLMILWTIDDYRALPQSLESATLVMNFALVFGVALWRHPGKWVPSLLITIASFAAVMMTIGFLVVGVPLLIDSLLAS
jgi:hypothetical protein